MKSVAKVSREIEVIKALMDAVEYTHVIEKDLNSVGPKAEKDQRTMGY